VKEIGENAFYGMSALTSINIPNGVPKIPITTFGYCRSLTNITIPNSVTKIGRGAFTGSGLISITIPKSVTTIENNAFGECPSLTTVTFEEGSQIQVIDTDVFSKDPSLTSINIPSSVNKIAKEAFIDSPSLSCVSYEGSAITSCGKDIFVGTQINSENPIHVTNKYNGDTLCSIPVVKDNLKCEDNDIQIARLWQYPNQSTLECLKGTQFHRIMIGNCWESTGKIREQCPEQVDAVQDFSTVDVEFWPCIPCRNLAGQVSTFWNKMKRFNVNKVWFILDDEWTSSKTENQKMVKEMVDKATALNIPFGIHVSGADTYEHSFGCEWEFPYPEADLWSDIRWRKCGGWNDNEEDLITEVEDTEFCATHTDIIRE